MLERNTTNINYELCSINTQIEYFEGLKYSECLKSYGGGQPYPLSGLDEEDFYKIKNKVIEMLKDCYNKKSDELIKFCTTNKFKHNNNRNEDYNSHEECNHDWILIKISSNAFDTINTYSCSKCGETTTISMGI